MRVTLESVSAAGRKPGVWLVPVFEGRLRAAAERFDFDVRTARDWGFSGEARQILPVSQATGNRSLLLVGAGRPRSLTPETARRLLAAALRSDALHKSSASSVVLWGDELESTVDDRPLLIEALAETALLSTFTFTALKSRPAAKPPRFPARLTLALSRARAGDRRHLREAVIMAEWTNWARTLLGQPQSHLTATKLANAARRQARRFEGVRCRILGPREIKALRMGLLQAVNQGSSEPPRFIELHYRGGARGARPIVLIGKGLTFDTGGYNLKPGDSMRGMHMDKGGGIAALASFFAAVEMKLPLNLVCLVPSTDNRVSGAAMCPGDVHVGISGISVEIDNTDAEGRLILADALGYAGRFKPSQIIDFATLTGAAVVALGDQATAMFCADDRMAEQLLQCSNATAELIWRLPLWSEYEDKLKSMTADIKNVGNRWGGAITAALFLQRFVPAGAKWCHLDIAGRTKAESDQGYFAAGVPYGFGPRLLGRWLRGC